MENVLKAGAVGVEIIISGKIPGARARSWRFYAGYLKKCGDTALTGVDVAQGLCRLDLVVAPPPQSSPRRMTNDSPRHL